MFEGFIGSDNFIVSGFAGTMIFICAFGILNCLMAFGELLKTSFGMVVLGGWILIGICGLGMIGLVLTGVSIGASLAYMGFLAALVWIFVEAAFFKEYDTEKGKPIGRWMTKYISSVGNR